MLLFLHPWCTRWNEISQSLKISVSMRSRSTFSIFGCVFEMFSRKRRCSPLTTVDFRTSDVFREKLRGCLFLLVGCMNRTISNGPYQIHKDLRRSYVKRYEFVPMRHVDIKCSDRLYDMDHIKWFTLGKSSFSARFLPNNVAKTKYFLVFVSSIISSKQEFEFWIESRNHSDKY